MKFKIEFNCDSAAFEHDAYGMISKIVRQIADKVENQEDGPQQVNDPSGNVIGEWSITGY